MWALSRRGSSRALNLRVPANAIMSSSFQTRRLEDPPRHVQLNPRGCLKLGVMIIAQIHLLVAPRATHHLPGITGEVGTVNNECPHGTHACRLLVLLYVHRP